MYTQLKRPRQRASLTLLGLGALVLVLIIAFAFRLADRTTRSGQEAVAAREVRTLTMDVFVSVLDAETGQRGYILARDATYLAPYTNALARLERDLPQLAALGATQLSLTRPVDTLRGNIAAKLVELKQSVDLEERGQHEEALVLVRTDRGKELMDRIRADTRAIVEGLEQRIEAHLQDTVASAAAFRTSTVLSGGAFVLFAGGAFLLSLRQMRDLDQARGELERTNQTLEVRVAERTADLTQANEEIQRFAYIVSHDLRAPLVNVMGFTKELEVATESIRTYFEAPEPDATLAATARAAARDDLPEAARFIRASTLKMDRLINAILKLSREGRRTMAKERVNLTELVAASASALQHQVDASATRLELPKEPTVIVSDRLALEQVFGNLLDNALKYLEPGRQGHIRVKIRGDRHRIWVTVADNGRGVAKEDLARIFEPFRRAGSLDKPGEGIGLTQVQALVRRLGGRISVTSRLHEGTSFEVMLPRVALE